MVFLGFSMGFPRVFLGFSMGFPVLTQWVKGQMKSQSPRGGQLFEGKTRGVALGEKPTSSSPKNRS